MQSEFEYWQKQIHFGGGRARMVNMHVSFFSWGRIDMVGTDKESTHQMCHLLK